MYRYVCIAGNTLKNGETSVGKQLKHHDRNEISDNRIAPYTMSCLDPEFYTVSMLTSSLPQRSVICSLLLVKQIKIFPQSSRTALLFMKINGAVEPLAGIATDSKVQF